MTTRSIRALLIEGTPLLQRALSQVLRDAGVLQVDCVTRTPDEPPSWHVDLVVASLPTLESSGRPSITYLRRQFRTSALVVYSHDVDRRRVFELLAMGVDGFIPESMPLNEMVHAFRKVLAGNMFVPTLQQDRECGSRPILTQRQQDIVSKMQQGLSNKQIARQLGISPETVKVHLYNIYRAIGVHNRVAAIAALDGIEPANDMKLADVRSVPLEPAGAPRIVA